MALTARDARSMAELAGQKADENRKKGFHCSESVLRALAEVLGTDVGPDMERISTVFRGGGGGYRDRCGALYGGVLVLNMLCRPGSEGEAARSSMVPELHRRFHAKLGSTMCSVLNPVAHYQWTEDFSCSVVFQAGAEIAVEVLLDYLEHHPDGGGVDLPSCSATQSAVSGR